MTRGVRHQFEEGQRFGRLTVVLPLDARVLALCDCGTCKAYARFNLANGNSQSCGCLKRDICRAKAIRDNPVQTRKAWADGKYDRQKVVALAEANSVKNRGTPGNGRNAKSSKHHSAKWYSMLSPTGRVVEGMNLNQLVRSNRTLFDPADVVMRKNAWGTEIGCKAMGGLRNLFAANSRAKSWKGWRGIERKESR